MAAIYEFNTNQTCDHFTFVIYATNENAAKPEIMNELNKSRQLPSADIKSDIISKYPIDKIISGEIQFDEVLTNEEVINILTTRYCYPTLIPEMLRDFQGIDCFCKLYCYIKHSPPENGQTNGSGSTHIFIADINRKKFENVIATYNTTFSKIYLQNPEYKTFTNKKIEEICSMQDPELFKIVDTYNFMKFVGIYNHRRYCYPVIGDTTPELKKQKLDFIKNSIMQPAPIVNTDDIPNSPIFKIIPKNYQKLTVDWAIRVLNQACRQRTQYNVQQEISLGNIFMNGMTGEFNSCEYRKWVAQYGICIIDDRGLGKTLEAIMIAELNPASNSNFLNGCQEYPMTEEDEHHFNQLYKGCSINMDVIAKRPRTRANLVIIPDQVSYQWIDEIRLYLNDNIGVFCNLNFMANQMLYMMERIDNTERHLFRFIYTIYNMDDLIYFTDNVDRILLGPNSVDYVFITFNMLSTLPAVLTNFYWWSVIIDEAHEILTELNIIRYQPQRMGANAIGTKEIVKYLKGYSGDGIVPNEGIKSHNKICLTGTPFTYDDNIQQYVWFMYEGNFNTRAYINNGPFTNHILSNLTRRNTEENVRAEVQLPPIVTEKRWLTLTSDEQNIYDTVLANSNADQFSDILRQLCCNPRINDSIKSYITNSVSVKELVGGYRKYFQDIADMVMLEFIEAEQVLKYRQAFIDLMNIAVFIGEEHYRNSNPTLTTQQDVISQDEQNLVSNVREYKAAKSVNNNPPNILITAPITVETFKEIQEILLEKPDISYEINNYTETIQNSIIPFIQEMQTNSHSSNTGSSKPQNGDFSKIIKQVLIELNNFITNSKKIVDKYRAKDMEIGGFSHHPHDIWHKLANSQKENNKKQEEQMSNEAIYDIASNMYMYLLAISRPYPEIADYCIQKHPIADKLIRQLQGGMMYLPEVMTNVQKRFVNEYLEYYNKSANEYNKRKNNAKNSKNSFEFINARHQIEKIQKNIEKNGYDKTTDEYCNICFEPFINNTDGNIRRVDIALIQCGHYFCNPCVKQISGISSNCPQCRFVFTPEKVKLISLAKPVYTEDTLLAKQKKLSPLEKLINVEGTKSAHIINYIQEHSQEHLIVFCIWDKALMRIKAQLESNGIRPLYCNGSAAEKDAAIREFQYGEGPNTSKIMLLSAENCVSGVTLTRASKILYVTPFYGTPEFRRQQELQANGRVRRIGQKAAQIEQIWFLIKQTCEQAIDTANMQMDIDSQ